MTVCTIYKVYLFFDTIGLAQFASDIPCHSQSLGFSGIVVSWIQHKAVLLQRVWYYDGCGRRGRNRCKIVDLCSRWRRFRLLFVLCMTSSRRRGMCSSATQDEEHEQREEDGEETSTERKHSLPPRTAALALLERIHGDFPTVTAGRASSEYLSVSLELPCRSVEWR